MATFSTATTATVHMEAPTSTRTVTSAASLAAATAAALASASTAWLGAATTTLYPWVVGRQPGGWAGASDLRRSDGDFGDGTGGPRCLRDLFSAHSDDSNRTGGVCHRRRR